MLLLFKIKEKLKCIIHFFHFSDTGKCLQNAAYASNHFGTETNHFALVGDSRIRQLFFEFLNHLDPEGKPSILEHSPDSSDGGSSSEADDLRPLEKAHSSLTYNNTKFSFRLSFYWRPVFDQSAVDLLHQLRKARNVPSVLVAGSGAWDMKLSNGSEKGLADYSSNLLKIFRVSHYLST